MYHVQHERCWFRNGKEMKTYKCSWLTLSGKKFFVIFRLSQIRFEMRMYGQQMRIAVSLPRHAMSVTQNIDFRFSSYTGIILKYSRLKQI